MRNSKAGNAVRNDQMINIFIGYDNEEPIAFHTCVQSIFEYTSVPVQITPVIKSQLDVYSRKRSDFESTDFSMTRFLVPYLSQYQGWSLFCDCDFIFKSDLKELWALRDESYSVMVCQHDYTPRKENKFLNQIQTNYSKKNWSSLMLFNNEKCKSLTPEYVNTAVGLDLHQFKWLENEKSIGSIPLEWNYLCEEDNQVIPPKGIHYTNGGPWFYETRETEFAADWKVIRNKAVMTGDLKKKLFSIDGVEYIVLPPQYKEKGKDADYLQIQNQQNYRKYTLKKDINETRGFQQKYSFIYTQYLGSLLAGYLGFDTQKSRIVEIADEKYLLTEDIRDWGPVIKMEPLSFYSHDLQSQSYDLNLLSTELQKYSHTNISGFFVKMLIFDFLIGNNQRDARSIRIFEIHEKNLNQQSIKHIKNNHAFLVETNFGSSFWSDCKNTLYHPSEIIQYIKDNNVIDEAKQLFNRIPPNNILRLIEIDEHLPSELKTEAITIFKQQFEKMLEVEDFVYNNTPKS